MIGLLALFLLMFFKTDELIQINDIENHKDEIVSLNGIAKNISYKNNNTRFMIYQECGVEIVSFEKKVDITSGSTILVTGKVQEYNGKMTVIADKIIT